MFLHNSEISIPQIELECELKPDVIRVGLAADVAAVCRRITPPTSAPLMTGKGDR